MSDNMPMTGKTCVITGGTGGIGKATAVGLARLGARVVITGHDQVRGDATAAEIRAAVAGAEVTLLLADLSSQEQVRGLARELLDRCERIDVLVNNAATAPPQRQYTTEGIDVTLATNYLAPVLLTELLVDRLRASAPARIVTVSSHTHHFVKSIPWAEVEGRGTVGPAAGYDLTKLFEVIWTLDLAEKLDPAEVTANCLHPGWPLKTGLHRQANGGFGIFLRLTQLFASPATKGAETSIHLASAPELVGVSGRYFANSHEADISDLARDPAVRRRLVELSARLCRLTPARPGL
jgi:NAD(P)-dependent dehydrogenase (short-subunit alcohol dehydrogenase family)